MSRLKTILDQSIVEDLGIWQAATMDGYWDYAANNDIQRVYLMGQIQATQSIHDSQGNNATRLRLKTLRRELKELERQK